MKRRIIVTGGRGFVAPYVADEIRKRLGRESDVLLTGRGAEFGREPGTDRLDVTDFQRALKLFDRHRPTHVVHLAGVAAIPNAVANMRSTWRVQLFGTLNVAQAILQTVPDCCLIYASSGQIYGASARYLPVLNEQAPLSPTNVYTASKAAADLALGAMVEIGLKVVRFRPFNHTGPKQSEDFVIPSFAMQIARIRAGFVLPVIKVGNLDVERDFLDVRDVASAYVRAIERSEEIGSGTVFNIASGKGQRIRDLLNRMIELSGLTISVVEDNTRVRNHDIARFVGDASKAKMELGWSPHYTFDDTLREMLSYAEIAVLSSAVGLQDGK